MITAAIQMNLTWEDRYTNHARARTLSEKATSSGATLIILPEMFATGFSMNPAITAEPPDGPTPTFLRTLATDLNVTIIGGYVEQSADGKGANTVFIGLWTTTVSAFLVEFRLPTSVSWIRFH